MYTSTLVRRLWKHCNVLRGDGMSYGDRVEQLTYLAHKESATYARPGERATQRRRVQ